MDLCLMSWQAYHQAPYWVCVTKDAGELDIYFYFLLLFRWQEALDRRLIVLFFFQSSLSQAYICPTCIPCPVLSFTRMFFCLCLLTSWFCKRRVSLRSCGLLWRYTSQSDRRVIRASADAEIENGMTFDSICFFCSNGSGVEMSQRKAVSVSHASVRRP